ncbi:hypothetical protein ZWY2020_004384 [Hordeum vulgare]|nr:hypothetical protein ZWY2020_004384 [Hordeum vulgare]
MPPAEARRPRDGPAPPWHPLSLIHCRTPPFVCAVDSSLQPPPRRACAQVRGVTLVGGGDSSPWPPCRRHAPSAAVVGASTPFPAVVEDEKVRGGAHGPGR